MSYTVQAAEPNASGTVRGVITPFAQTIAGVKTLVDDLQLSADKGLIGTGGNTFREVSGGGGWITNANTRLDVGGYYVAAGGVLSGLNPTGFNATAGSYGADIYQAQASYQVQVASAKGASAGIVVKIGSTDAAPHGAAELLRVGYGLGGYLGSDGTAVFSVFKGVAATLTQSLNLISGGDYQIYGKSILQAYNYSGNAAPLLYGFAANGGGKAALNIGNSPALAETEDMIRVANGTPDVQATVFRVKPSGKADTVMGTGTGYATAHGVAYCDAAIVGSGADTTEDTLKTWPLPASSLDANNKGLRVTMFGDGVSTGDVTTIRAYFGATAVLTKVLTASQANTWRCVFEVTRTGAATQTASGVLHNGGTAQSTVQANAAPAETLSGAVTIKCTGQRATSSVANSLRCLFMMVEFIH